MNWIKLNSVFECLNKQLTLLDPLLVYNRSLQPNRWRYQLEQLLGSSICQQVARVPVNTMEMALNHNSYSNYFYQNKQRKMPKLGQSQHATHNYVKNKFKSNNLLQKHSDSKQIVSRVLLNFLLGSPIWADINQKVFFFCGAFLRKCAPSNIWWFISS